MVLGEKFMVTKNEIYEVEIEDLGMNGEGVAHIDGQVVFVPFAIVGEKVKIKIINTKTKIAVGKIVEILRKSNDRVQLKCKYFEKCGGCDLQHLNYNKTLEFKQMQVKKNLKQIAKLDVMVSACQKSEPYFYRNKCALPVICENGKNKIGFFREFSHSVIEIDDCVVTKPFVADLIKITKNYMQKFNLFGFDEQNHGGDIKHIVARKVGEFLIVTLVVSSLNIKGVEFFYQKLQEKFKNCSLWLNLNTLNNNVIFGDKFVFKFGQKQIFQNIMGLKVSVNPASFLQVNDEICEKIYTKVQDEIEEDSIVIDAYSGAGIMTGITAKKSKHSYGLEIVKQATEDANFLKQINNISNMTNINGDCSKTLCELLKTIKEKINIILDPPRKGCDKRVLDAVILSGASKIIYISCNSATLARDLAYLTQNSNYKVKYVEPFDMFPQTRHVETLCILGLEN